MVNILILSNNPKNTRQLGDSLLQFASDLKIHVSRTLADADQYGQDKRLRMAFVDRDLVLGQEVALAERLRGPLINRFLPIIMLDSDRSTGNNVGRVVGIVSADAGQAEKSEALFSDLGRAALGMLFITFPYENSQLKRLLDQVFVEWRTRESRTGPRVFIDQAGAARWLSEEEIVFVEYASRRVVIHTRKETIEYKYMPLQKFAAQLSPQFIQVHQSYVVNFPAVKSYNRQQAALKLSGSPVAVPVGRSYQKRVAELIKGLE
ncbi:MAG: LytTR family transcriptional regulator [Clostridia bacterium]|nr:LytTR family transcriptional regulator [Clostridia bacterium]